MPTNALNTAFMKEPHGFIEDPTHAVGGHDDLVQAMGGTREQTLVAGTPLWKNARSFLEIVDAVGQLSFDLKPYGLQGHKMLVMQPVQQAGGSRSSWTASLPAPSDNPVQGYWFPYKTISLENMKKAKEGAGPAEVMGYVDFPIHDPAHPFVFTGSMQGCHIVVTISPKDPTKFRAHHYPNAAVYLNTASEMTFHHWPSAKGGKVCAWLDDSQYAADPPEAVDAFNFLHYRDGAWYIHTQMQKRTTLLQKSSGVVLFEVMGTAVSEPIPTEPLGVHTLMSRHEAWKAACARRP